MSQAEDPDRLLRKQGSNEVTVEDVRSVASELVASPRTLSVVGPFDGSDFDERALQLG